MSQPNLKQLMEQAKEMQKRMQAAQEELANQEIIGKAGGTSKDGHDLVEVTMTCRHEVRKLFIAEETWKEDKEIIEGLIIAAFNDAIRKAEKESQGKISALTREMGLPEGL